MRILYILLIASICAASAAAEPFVPEPLELFQQNQDLQSDSISPSHPVEFHFTITGGPANVILTIMTWHTIAPEGPVLNGHLDWHYVDAIDTCIYISPVYMFEDGDNVISWDGVSNDGEQFWRATRSEFPLMYSLFAWHTGESQRVAPDGFPDAGQRMELITHKDYAYYGTLLDHPMLYAGTERWEIGGDPLDTSLIETTTFPVDALQTGPPIPYGVHNPAHAGYFAVPFFDPDPSRRSVRSFNWVPNGVAIPNPDWEDRIEFSVPETGFSPGGMTFDGTYLHLVDSVVNDGNPGLQMMIVDAEYGERIHDITRDTWPPLGPGPTLPANTAPPVATFGYGGMVTTFGSCLVQMLNPNRYMETEEDNDLLRWVNRAPWDLSSMGGDVAFTDATITGFGNVLLAREDGGTGSFTLLASDGTYGGRYMLPGNGTDSATGIKYLATGGPYDGIYTSGSNGGVCFTPAAETSGRLIGSFPTTYLGLRVIAPNGGEELLPGEQYTIVFTKDFGPPLEKPSAAPMPDIYVINFHPMAATRGNTLPSMGVMTGKRPFRGRGQCRISNPTVASSG